MALSVLVVVGEAKEWLPELAKRASELKVGGGFEEGVEVYAPSLLPSLCSFVLD